MLQEKAFPRSVQDSSSEKYFDFLGSAIGLKQAARAPRFFSGRPRTDSGASILLLEYAIGVMFGGIHCIGWKFTFSSRSEQLLWRISSATITGYPALGWLWLLITHHPKFDTPGDRLILAADCIHRLIFFVRMLTLQSAGILSSLIWAVRLLVRCQFPDFKHNDEQYFRLDCPKLLEACVAVWLFQEHGANKAATFDNCLDAQIRMYV
jgi:hypothetical protein